MIPALILLHLFVVQLAPGNFFILNKLVERLTRTIEADPDNFESFVVKFFVVRFDVGEFGNTRAAPRRPEVNQDHLSTIGGPVQRFSIQLLPFDGHELSGESNATALSREAFGGLLDLGVFGFAGKLRQLVVQNSGFFCMTFAGQFRSQLGCHPDCFSGKF